MARKHYAGTVFEHRKQARGQARELRSWVKEFRAVIKSPSGNFGRKCREALGLLVGAAAHRARYDQERAWGASGRGGRRASRTAIAKMERTLYSVCMTGVRDGRRSA